MKPNNSNTSFGRCKSTQDNRWLYCKSTLDNRWLYTFYKTEKTSVSNYRTTKPQRPSHTYDQRGDDPTQSGKRNAQVETAVLGSPFYLPLSFEARRT